MENEFTLIYTILSRLWGKNHLDGYPAAQYYLHEKKTHDPFILKGDIYCTPLMPIEPQRRTLAQQGTGACMLMFIRITYNEPATIMEKSPVLNHLSLIIRSKLI